MPFGIHPSFNPPQRSTENKFASTNYVHDLLVDLGIPGLSNTEERPVALQSYFCKLIDDETGNAKYKCEVWTPKGEFFDPTTSLTATQIEGVKVFANAVYINLQENAASTHDLTDAANTNQKYFIAVLFGFTSEATPRAVLVGNGAWFDTCPSSLLSGSGESSSTLTADYSMTAVDTFVLVDPSSGDVDVTLPDPAGTNVAGTPFLIKKIDAGANVVNVLPYASETIDDDASYVLEFEDEYVELTSDGANWFVTGD